MNDVDLAHDKATTLEEVLITGDLKNLSTAQRVEYYTALCKSLDLNPLTKPFEYITLNGKLTLYARRDCTEQIRARPGKEISITIVAREVVNDTYVVTARATNLQNRQDESIGAVSIANLKGENLANAMMKAETKAKRRVTLSIAGLGMIDESEVSSVPGAKFPDPPKLPEGTKPYLKGLVEEADAAPPPDVEFIEPTPQEVALAEHLSVLEGIAPDDTQHANDAMIAAGKDDRFNGDDSVTWNKLQDYFYARFPTFTRKAPKKVKP